MFGSNKLNDQMTITQQKLGNGAFGSVYVAKVGGKDVAVKCESKDKNENLTLLREFKICRKIHVIKKYLNILSENSVNNKDLIESLELNSIVKVFKYINDNNLLMIPEEFNINLLIKTTCVPETYSYIECNDFNFLTMELCGENLESIIDKNTLSEDTKYFIAYKLLYTLSCIHRCGIIHRDIKLSNFVLNEKYDFTKPINKIVNPIIIDLGLAKEFYKYEGGKVLQISPYAIKSITGTLRYISLNIHEFKSPSIIDDLISLCYSLLVIFTGKSLPWVGHKKDSDKFDSEKHTETNCKCGYHKNKQEGLTKNKNTIAEVKFHTPLEELTDNKYEFLISWIKYLYSLKPKQLPSYNFLFKKLKAEKSNCDKLNKFIINKK
jgi:serine/threonine protein kinase